jgi:hypothetical protein
MNITIPMSDGTLYVGELKKEIQYYRVPHDKERKADGSYVGDGYWGGEVRDRAKLKPIPEVYRLYPDQTTPIDCKWLRLWWSMNPNLDREHFQLLLDDHWMLCNGTGFPSRYNCLTGKPGTDPDDKNKNPAFHASIINGGAVVSGEKVGGILYLDSLLISDELPFDYTSREAAEKWLLANPHKWYYATTVAKSGNITYTTFSGISGERERLRIPILTNQRVYIPLRELDQLPLGFIPPESNWRP